MADHRAKIERAARGILHPAEQVLATVRAVPKTSPVGLLGGVVVQAVLVSEERRRVEELGFPASSSMVLAVTNRRLLVFRTPSLGASAKFKGEVPYGRLRGVEVDRRGLNASLRFFLEPRGEVSFTTYRRDHLEAFVDALTRSHRAWSTTAVPAAPTPSIPAVPPPPPI